MKKALAGVMIICMVITIWALMSRAEVMDENERLKKESAQSRSSAADYNSQLTFYKRLTSNFPTINYLSDGSKRRFVEMKSELRALPVEGFVTLREIDENTVIDIIDTAAVGNEIWHYVEIPVYDTPSSYKGWIKEIESAPYTKVMFGQVQGDVHIKEGDLMYETFSFEDIQTITPVPAQDYERGRIEERKDGYVLIGCPGGRSVWVKEASVIYPKVLD